MEDLKKRKLEETGNAQFDSEEDLRLLLDPLAKNQLVHLLAKLGCQYPSIAEEIKSIASSDPVHRKLFVRGLAWNTSSETLCAAFQGHGEIEEGAVIVDKTTGKSRGYGFITYKDMESAHSALRAPTKMIDGRMAACSLACEGVSNTSTKPDITQRKLYVGGLSSDTTSEMLLSFFETHGEIEEGSVAYDKETNRSRGFGFVTYKTAEGAKKAIDDTQKTLGGRNITVKFADNYRGKLGQAQVGAGGGGGMVPVVPAIMSGAGYHHHPQPGKPHSVPIGYGNTYPSMATAYPNLNASAGYPSPPSAAYSTQPQILYPHQYQQQQPYGGPSPTPPAAGMGGGYPFYAAKQ